MSLEGMWTLRSLMRQHYEVGSTTYETAVVFNNSTVTVSTLYRNSTPTPNDKPFLLCSAARVTRGREKLISNRAMGWA